MVFLEGNMIKGIRGAIDVKRDEPGLIYSAARSLLENIIVTNELSVEDIIAVFFTVTPDLKSAYPAKAARDMGWVTVPMMCLQEMNVEGSLPYCIRVLIQVNWDKEREVKHVYLGKAKELRPDL